NNVPNYYAIAASTQTPASVTITNNQSGNDLLGELNDLDQPYYTKTGANNGPNNRGLNNPYGIAIDAVAHRLFVADYNNNRVVVYTLDSGNNIQSRVMTNVLGQPDLSSNGSATTQSGMYWPYGVAYDAANARLFVADYTNNRVLVHNVSSITNGQNAANVLGQATFTTGTFTTTQSGMKWPYGGAYDAANARLFVADY